MKTTLPEGFRLGYGYWEKGSSGLLVEGGQLLHKCDDSGYGAIDDSRDAETVARELDSELKRTIEPRIEELKKKLADAEKEAVQFSQAIEEVQRLFPKQV